MKQPGIRKSLDAMQALCVIVIFSEHSFRDNSRNTQCSNATAIDCRAAIPSPDDWMGGSLIVSLKGHHVPPIESSVSP